MAKKAQLTSKSGVKAKAQAVAKKPSKAVALAKSSTSVKALKSKSPEKVVSKVEAVKKTVIAAVEKKTAVANPLTKESVKKATTTAAVGKKTALKSSSSKASQAAETAEKVKIDKSMTEEQAKWVEMYNKYKDAQASNYDMKATFKAAAPIQHKVLGWGWVVSNENDRLEVLFKDGKRMLISNYRGS